MRLACRLHSTSSFDARADGLESYYNASASMIETKSATEREQE